MTVFDSNYLKPLKSQILIKDSETFDTLETYDMFNYDKNLFEMINQEYLPANTGLIGSGGNAIFTFKLKKQANYPKYSIIKFKYSRSWEQNTAIYKEIKILFLVRNTLKLYF